MKQETNLIDLEDELEMESQKRSDISRRGLLKTSALLGGTALGLPVIGEATQFGGSQTSYRLNRPENIIYTVCLQCNTGCGLKVKLIEGVAAKLDGNPISPNCMCPQLPAASSAETIAGIDGALCPRGQAGIQSVYDPYRLRKVLKRAGKRGEGKWVSISFEQAIREIVDGGLLFKYVPGEANRRVPGLRESYVLSDAKVAKVLDADVTALKNVIKDVRKKKEPESKIVEAIAEFKKKHAAHLDLLIDPDHPDFGPKNNQLVFNWGRMKAGRSEFVRRFVTDAFGSVNAHGHTTVCQGSLYFTGKAMSEQWALDEKTYEVKWTGGDKFYWQADLTSAEFVLFVGASPFEGNYGPPMRTPRITNGLVDGRMKIAVADPRFSKTASKAWKWLPIKPGYEACLALAMIRWIIENQKFDAKYLAAANKAAAKGAGEPNWCNATWLVKLNDKGQPDKFLRAHEVGLGEVEKRTTPDGKEYAYERFVVMANGVPVAVDANDEKTVVNGDLFVSATVKDASGKDTQVKSSLQLLKESANEYTIEQWCDLAGISASDVLEIAQEFVKHGKKSVADIHRGVSQHTNGFYNCYAYNSLNLLMGNFDWQGGFIKGTTWNITGEKSGKEIEGKPFPFNKLHPNKAKAFGISSIRHDVKYEETTLFQGYPAKRLFYPLSSDVYQDVIPSIADQYPYPVKALIQYMASPVYALPGGDKLIPMLMDTEKLPLFISVDIVVGETSMYADYIFPDLSYLERWEFQGSHPCIANKVQPVRQPAIAPIPDTVKVYGEEMPISLEALLMGIAEALKLPGFGKGGFGEGQDFTRPEQFYLRMVANIAVGDKVGEEVPDADAYEMRIFEKARAHLPKSVFDLDGWKAVVGEANWPKVVHVLNRGGRYEDFEKHKDGLQVKHKYGKLINMYSEKAAGVKSAITGKAFAGYAKYYPPALDCSGTPIDAKGHDLKLVTYREITMTKSRTAGNYWLTQILPENALLMNKKDADARKLKDGDYVNVTSLSNPGGAWNLGNGNKVPMTILVKVVQGMRPGTVAFALGFGHWAYGATTVTIDGQKVEADPRRARGSHLNAAMQIDPVLKNTALADPVGASVAFYDTMVKVAKVAKPKP